MVDQFTVDGVYETPYAFENSRCEGLKAIRQRFAMVSASAWNKAVTIDNVTVKNTPTQELSTVVVEFFIIGTRRTDGEPFNFPSSTAIIHTRDGCITHYQDYPNMLGIARSADILEQFAQTLKT